MTPVPRARSKRQVHCRICGSANMRPYLDLGRTPLANAYLSAQELALEEFQEELALQVCLDCGLSQLTMVVPPDLMFKNYLYVSSTTETFRKHCEGLARHAVTLAACKAKDLVLDIASNDGCLLSKFRAEGMTVVGVDPAENLAREANEGGIPTLCAYWSSQTAKEIVARFGHPKVVTATNVLAHVDDLHKFIRAVGTCLAPGGIFVLECPYVIDFVERNEFDTAYHEHLSYLGIHPLASLMGRHGLSIVGVDYFGDIHGGTIRVSVGRTGDYQVHPRVGEYLAKEQAFGIKDLERYRAFGERVRKNKERLIECLERLHKQGQVIWAYGASAKGNTLMNYFGLLKDLIPVAIDDNPKKWGFFTPGAHMRITGIDELARSKVDYLLLLAWNFEPEIRRRCRAVGYAGGFIVPVPEVRVIEQGIATTG